MSGSMQKAMNSGTFRTIEQRLANLLPAIELRKHIGTDIRVHDSTLDGIDFFVKDRDRLINELRAARTLDGEPVFAEGSKEDVKHWQRKGIKGDPKHWALNLSFASTNGIGFREIWRFKLSGRALRIADARPPGLGIASLDGTFSGNFGDDMNLPDFSSLHVAVSEDKTADTQRTICNIHIDQTGFVMSGPDQNLVVNPDFLRHLVVELLWKTKLKGKIPGWARERVDLVLPSSYNAFSKVGLGYDFVKSNEFNLSLTGACGLAGMGGFECVATFNLTGTHNLLGSK